jgi:hypothetical protein
MVIEAVCKEVYGSGFDTDSRVISGEQLNRSLKNLKRFFDGWSRQSNTETNDFAYESSGFCRSRWNRLQAPAAAHQLAK